MNKRSIAIGVLMGLISGATWANFNAKLDDVIRGDLIKVKNLDTDEEVYVQLQHISAPHANNKWYQRSTDSLRNLLTKGEQATGYFQVEEQGKYNEAKDLYGIVKLPQLHAQAINANEYQLQTGNAWSVPDKYDRAQALAKQHHWGIWSNSSK